jgi:hypothetical protein
VLPWDARDPAERRPSGRRGASDAELVGQAAHVVTELRSLVADERHLAALVHAAGTEYELAATRARGGGQDAPSRSGKGPGKTGQKFVDALRANGGPLQAKHLIPQAMGREDNSTDRTVLRVLVEQGHLFKAGRRRGYALPEWGRRSR